MIIKFPKCVPTKYLALKLGGSDQCEKEVLPQTETFDFAIFKTDTNRYNNWNKTTVKATLSIWQSPLSACMGFHTSQEVCDFLWEEGRVIP